MNDIELASAGRLSEEVLPEPFRSSAVPQEELQRGHADAMLWVVADERNIPIGYCLLQTTGGQALLEQIDVAEEHGRQGLGRALVQKAVERARELGFTRLYLTTFARVPWNAPFYAGMGFCEVLETELPDAIRSSLVLEREHLANRIAMCREL